MPKRVNAVAGSGPGVFILLPSLARRPSLFPAASSVPHNSHFFSSHPQQHCGFLFSHKGSVSALTLHRSLEMYLR